MAFVFKDPNSPYYTASWRDKDGRWCRKSTKQKLKPEAQKIAENWQTNTKAAVERLDDENWRRYLVEDFSKRLLGPELTSPNCRKWFEQWMNGKSKGVSAHTIERYAFSINNFLKLLGSRAEKPLDCITAQDIIAFRDKISKQGKRAATVNMDLKIIRAVLERAKEIGYISRNPSYAVDLLPKHTDTVERIPFAQEQVRALLATTIGTDWHGVILMGYYTALRLSDITNMQWSAIDMEKRIISLVPQKTRRLNKRIQIPIHEQLYAWLKNQPTPIKTDVHVFPTLINYCVGGRYGLSGRFVKIMEDSGIKRECTRSGHASRATSSLSFHSLRHTFASELANQGVAPEIRMKLTGHNSSKVHEGYTHLEVETIRLAVDKMPCMG
jgi:integrase